MILPSFLKSERFLLFLDLVIVIDDDDDDKVDFFEVVSSLLTVKVAVINGSCVSCMTCVAFDFDSTLQKIVLDLLIQNSEHSGQVLRFNFSAYNFLTVFQPSLSSCKILLYKFA